MVKAAMRILVCCVAMVAAALCLAPRAAGQSLSIEQARQLAKQAPELAAQGRYNEAIRASQRALQTYIRVFGPEHPETATMFGNIAILYQDVGDLATAEQYYQRAVRVFSTRAPNDRRFATALDNLGGLYNAMGAYEKAEPLYQRALQFRERALGSAHPELAISLNNLADLYRAKGDYARAQPLYKRALSIDEAALGPTHHDTVVVMNNLAVLYFDRGEYLNAQPLYERALAIRERTPGPDHPDTAVSLNNLAELLQALGEYRKAQPLLHRALAIREKAFGAKHPDTANSYNNLGLLYEASGDYSNAEVYYKRALAIREEIFGRVHPTIADTLSNLASVYYDTGAYTNAQPLFQRALAVDEQVLGHDHQATASVVNNTAALYAAMGHADKALHLYRDAVGRYEKSIGPRHPVTLDCLDGLAGVLESTGNFAEAGPLLLRTLSVRENTFGPDNADVAQSFNNVAAFYHLSGQYDKAKPMYERALAIDEKSLGSDSLTTALVLNNLAALAFATGAYGESAARYASAQRITELNVSRFLLSGSESRKQTYLRQQATHVSMAVSLSVTHAAADTAALGLTAVLQYKGRVLDAVSDNVARLRRSVAPQDRAVFDHLAEVAQQLSTLTFSGPGNQTPQAYRQLLASLAAEQERLEEELSTRSSAFERAASPVTLKAVRDALSPDTTLLEYFRYIPFDPRKAQIGSAAQARYVAYVLRGRADPIAVDLGEALSIEDLVTELRTALSDPDNSTFNEVSAELTARIFSPLRSYLDPNDRLLICPDGALNLVPFAALREDPEHYLVQKFELSYLTSGRDLLRIATASRAQSGAVILANPNFGTRRATTASVSANPSATRAADFDRRGFAFTPLPETQKEADSIAALLHLDAQHILTGDRATEASLRALHGPLILHIATHGFFLTDQQAAATLNILTPKSSQPSAVVENPLLRSGLALAGANLLRSGPADDGILTAAEAAQLDLSGTQLVVLSACESGLGTVQMGEGVYGLRRALVLAGAQTELMSLWKVADTDTRDLMIAYYHRLKDGQGRAAALTQTQRAFLSDPRHQHPFYWASFIPVGNWTPLGPP